MDPSPRKSLKSHYEERIDRAPAFNIVYAGDKVIEIKSRGKKCVGPQMVANHNSPVRGKKRIEPKASQTQIRPASRRSQAVFSEKMHSYGRNPIIGDASGGEHKDHTKLGAYSAKMRAWGSNPIDGGTGDSPRKQHHHTPYSPNNLDTHSRLFG
eukprot:TRINITY_DN44625_c0_g1_i1.p1 TRINITY_DN44625_c0_g1~~TRINITY_DN44625_c0_g1_i1.p1  ORF type:complete len:154 (-),score=29.71 TRINITY_DN44625_c0_g1_i1:308-769(-)